MKLICQNLNNLNINYNPDNSQYIKVVIDTVDSTLADYKEKKTVPQ